MTLRKLILVGGALNLAMAVFHLGFPWIFAWETALAPLDPDTRGLVFALAWAATLLLFFIAFASLVFSDRLLGDRLGRAFCGFVAAFYLLRVAEEFSLFQNPLPVRIGLVVTCLGIATLYAAPLLRRSSAASAGGG